MVNTAALGVSRRGISTDASLGVWTLAQEKIRPGGVLLSCVLYLIFFCCCVCFDYQMCIGMGFNFDHPKTLLRQGQRQKEEEKR